MSPAKPCMPACCRETQMSLRVAFLCESAQGQLSVSGRPVVACGPARSHIVRNYHPSSCVA